MKFKNVNMKQKLQRQMDTCHKEEEKCKMHACVTQMEEVPFNAIDYFSGAENWGTGGEEEKERAEVKTQEVGTEFVIPTSALPSVEHTISTLLFPVEPE